MRIDQVKRARETRLSQVAKQDRAHRGLAIRGADQRDRARLEELVEVAHGHRIIRLQRRHLSRWAFLCLPPIEPQMRWSAVDRHQSGLGRQRYGRAVSVYRR